MARKVDRKGLSLGYRILWRIRYIGMHLYGPAELDAANDPHARLRAERQAKVEAARQARSAR